MPLKRSATEATIKREGKPRTIPRLQTAYFEPCSVIDEDEEFENDSEGRSIGPRRRSLTWQGYYMSKKAKVQELLLENQGSNGRSASKPSLPATAPSAEASTDAAPRSHDDSNASPSKATLKSRKISLSCLVTSVLNFERGRRRASRAREEDLLNAAEMGDLIRVRRLCDNEGVINVNCTDPLGRTPLHLAVANEQKEVVQFLLGHVDMKAVYQALMLAINLGHDEIAEMIIEHPLYEEISADIRRHGQATFLLNAFGYDNQFSEEITPLILAAQQNRFEIVMALLMKGEVIGKPHKYSCSCEECDRSAKCDELKFAKARLNAYKGLASEAYISLSSEDPILTSFELRKELLNVSTDEKYYTAEYTALAEQLSEYVVRLLDKVHGNEELNAILNADEDSESQTAHDDTLPRLSLAIEYKEKKFVAHPSCQKKLTTMWYAEFTDMMKKRSRLFTLGFIFSITLFYPVLAVIYILHPKFKFMKLLRTPVVKFIAQATSFVMFLCLILTHSYVEQTKICSTRFTDDDDIKRNWLHYKENLTSEYAMLNRMCIRNYTPSFLEVLILLWIAGLVWQECKQVYSSGCKTHFLDVYNHMDFFMLKFYISSLALRQMQHIIVTNAYDYFRYSYSWKKLIGNDEEALYKLYFLNADRFYWDAWDPYHVSEALFAVGNILNFTRLFYLLAISEHLGPMLISLERMLKDVMKFFVAFVPIFITFMVGLYNMYWYYNPTVRGKVELVDHNITTRAEEGFGSLEYTFRTVYWSLFGLKDSKLVEVHDKKKQELGYEGRFTESVGYIVFGVYNWGAVIVLLNMLIAMMTRSFEKITIHQDIEWKFARSKLYMEYIEPGSTLPVPFNLVPSVKSLRKILKLCFQICDVTKYCKNQRRHRTKKENLLITFSVNSSIDKPNSDCERNAGTHCETTYVAGDNADHYSPIKTEHLEANHCADQTGASNVNGTDRSPGASPRWQPRGSFAWGGDQASKDDYRTVVKRVVRRYIFEHLQATVGGEGSNEQQNAEALRQEFHGVHTEINSIKPKVQSEFDRVRADMCDIRMEVKSMQHSIEGVYCQLNEISQLCKALAQVPRCTHYADQQKSEYESHTYSSSSADYSDHENVANSTPVFEPPTINFSQTLAVPAIANNTQNISADVLDKRTKHFARSALDINSLADNKNSRNSLALSQESTLHFRRKSASSVAAEHPHIFDLHLLNDRKVVGSQQHLK